MKKKVLFLMISIIGIISVICAFGTSNSNESIRDIYVKDNNQIYNYLKNKYDMIDKEVLNINESFSLEDGINKLSSDNNYIDVSLMVNKKEKELKLEYTAFSNEKSISDLLNLSLLLVDNEIFIVSRYDYVNINELNEFRSINECASVSIAGEKLFGNAVYTLDGGSGGFVGAAVGAVLGVSVLYGINNIKDKLFVGTSNNMVTTSNPVSSSNSISKKFQDAVLRLSAKDFLDKEENDYGWTDNELKEKLKESIKLVIIGGEFLTINELNFDDEKRTICLGIYKDIVYDEIYKNISYIKSAKQETVIFSSSFNWDEVERLHTKEGMWLLNKFFLYYWINKNCDFLLLTNPNPFYIDGMLEPIVPSIDKKFVINPKQDDNKNEKIGYFYGKELKYISSKGYKWDSQNLPKDLIISCEIKATRSGISLA